VIDQALNIFFFVFHTAVIIFNLSGWIWRKTRKANLVLLLFTAGSWFVLGIWYGFGFCPCTEWHWQVRARLGYLDMSPSYLVFLIRTLTGVEVDKSHVDIFAVAFLFSALAISVSLNVRDFITSRTKAAGD
jgi:hypothetical protein